MTVLNNQEVILQIHRHWGRSRPNLKKHRCGGEIPSPFKIITFFLLQSKLQTAKRLQTLRRMDALAARSRDGESRNVCAENKGGSTVANPKAKGFCKHLERVRTHTLGLGLVGYFLGKPIIHYSSLSRFSAHCSLIIIFPKQTWTSFNYDLLLSVGKKISFLGLCWFFMCGSEEIRNHYVNPATGKQKRESKKKTVEK